MPYNVTGTNGNDTLNHSGIPVPARSSVWPVMTLS
jgi:hypothetical protein